ncbi:MAG: hypothetical protein M1828_005280 [Chrysothrix sp. TS-e1954]|nr:MAG: hypothetical protein M1828_005280 [Chrysothrix sp. TS-e1954]
MAATAAMDKTHYDFIIVGGGTAGCVVASRLVQQHPALSIALIEAGPNASDNPQVQDPRAAPLLHDTDLQWKYTTASQTSLGGRQTPYWGGKLLSGSSGVNYTAWTRGHTADYDRWAGLVKSSSWSYNELLPAFKRSEHHYGDDAQANEQHGFDGPIRTQSGDFGFPLREPMRKGFETAGFAFNSDMNSGDPNGIAPLVVNWHQLQRQSSSICYPMEGIHILPNSVVSKVILEDCDGNTSKKATGVELAGSGKVLHALREVIVSCGSIRTPQLLQLSGIGSESELQKYGVPCLADLPAVGKNLMDHPAVTMFWKVRHPDKGLAFGSPAFNNPNYANSLPMDWFVTGKVPDEQLEMACKTDETTFETGPRSDYELTPMYLTNGAVPAPWLPMDGEHISCGIMCLSATSRGTVSLNSTDPHDNPVIDPQYVSTEHDRVVLRAGMRYVMQAMSSPAMQEHISTETPPPGLQPLTVDSSDAELDERIDTLAFPWYHAAGTASMGSVVDTECRVYGVQGLRVVDASIIPLTVTAHLQAPVYALAEQASSMISSSLKAGI